MRWRHPLCAILVLAAGCSPLTWEQEVARLSLEIPSFEPEPNYLLAFAREAGGDPDAPDAKFARLFRDGKPCGNAVALDVENGDKTVSFSALVLYTATLGRTARVCMAIRSVSDSDGSWVSYETLQRVGNDVKRTRGAFLGDEAIQISTEERGTCSEKQVMCSRRSLTTEGDRRKRFEEKGLADGTRFHSVRWNALDEEVESRDLVLGSLQTIEISGQKQQVRSLTTECHESGCEVGNVDFVNERFETVRSQSHSHSPVYSLISMQATREEALAPLVFSNRIQLPELVVPEALSLKCDRISGHWGADIVVRSTRADGLLPHLPETEQHEVRWGPPGQATIVTRQLKAKPARVPWPEVEDPEARRLLLPSSHVQSDDPRVIALAREATRESHGSCDAVKDIETFVSMYLERDTSARRWSAAEAMTAKRGDCKAFSALTAALCRASGIPARIVRGVVYGDTIHRFRPHEWVEAYQRGRWIGLDAALREYTVDRIALAVDCEMSEGGDCGNYWLALENLEIVDIRLHDRAESGPRR